MGEVWLAEHITQQLPVAIKVLDSSKPHSLRALKSFRKEVRASAALDHPNIIKVFDYGIIDPKLCPESGEQLAPGSPYFVMEYARGGSLNKLAHTLSWPQIRDILLTILRALSHAHARGVIHRDLKPGNILLRQGSQALDDLVLSDFGLAWAIRDAESLATTSQARLLGTPAYMAPEQINNQLHNQGPWTDLYALGCLTWLLIHGQTPYGVEPTDEVLRAHISGKLPPWDPIVSVPDSLRSWLKVMLASDPGARFGFAATAARELYHLDSLSGASALPTLWEESEPSPPHQNLSGVGLGLYELRPVPLVGRQKERKQLWAEFHATLDTRSPRIVLMRGGAGVGKSRLAQWLIQRVHERGLAIPMIAGHEPNPQAFDGIAKMLAHEMRSIDLDRPKALKRAKSHLKRWRTPDDTPEILEQDALTLTDILHPLRGGISSSAALGLRSDQWRERQLTLLRHLDRITRAHPVVVWLDDIQWASEALSLVKAAMTVWNRPLPVLFVMTLREESHSPQRAEYHQLEELLSMPLAIRQLEIEPMEPLTHNALLKKLLPLDERLTSEVERRAGGNPLFTIQLIGDWVQRGVLRADGNRWALAPGEDLSIPSDIHQLWRQRINQIAHMFDRDERLRAEIALENASVLGRDILPQEWIDACALMGVTIPDGLIERMIKHRMAQASDVGWSFYHEMLRESLQLLAKKSGRLSEHHRACAMMLQRRYGNARGHVSERLAYHLLGAGLYDDALEPMLDALNNLRIQGEFVQANKLLARWQEVIDKLRLSHGDPRQIKGLLARAHLHISAGEIDEARRSLDAATQHAELNHDPQLLACVYLSRGLLARKRGSTQLTLDELFRALELFREASPDKDLGRCLVSLGEVHVTLGKFNEAKTFLLEAIEIFRALRSHDALGQALMSLGEMFYENNNTTQGARFIQEAIAQFQHQSNRIALALCYNLQGEIARKRGELDDAVHYYQRSLALMRAIGSRDAIYPSVNLGFTMLERSDYAGASKILEPLTRELEEQQRWAYLACTQLGLACCDAAVMDWDSWDERFEKARAHIIRARAVEPDAAALAERTGTQCASLGHKVRARRAFELALEQLTQLNQHRSGERVRQKLAAL